MPAGTVPLLIEVKCRVDTVQAVKANGGVEVDLHSFLISTSASDIPAV
jgi:hypothetical protein